LNVITLSFLRYCVPNGRYVVSLNDTLLFNSRYQHATVTFISSGYNVTLSGINEVLTGVISVGESDETWFESTTYQNSKNEAQGFGAAVSQASAFIAVGSPYCQSSSGCSTGGSVSIFSNTGGNGVIATVCTASNEQF
jgi:hypothetical protein